MIQSLADATHDEIGSHTYLENIDKKKNLNCVEENYREGFVALIITNFVTYLCSLMAIMEERLWLKSILCYGSLFAESY